MVCDNCPHYYADRSGGGNYCHLHYDNDEPLPCDLAEFMADEPRTYKIVMESMSGTRKDLWTDLSYNDAFDLCNDYGWVFCPNGEGYIWDLSIEEE